MERPSRRALIAVAVVAVIAVLCTVIVWVRRSGLNPIAVEPHVQCQIEGCVVGAVSTASGRLWLEQEDISVDPSDGVIELKRTYFRDDTTSSSFGRGWRSILDTRLDTDGSVPVLSGFATLPSSPLGFDDGVVTFADGTRWTFGTDGALVAITSRTGRESKIHRTKDQATIADDDEILIEIAYEGGRVASVADKRPGGAGAIAYSYDGDQLVSVAHADGDRRDETYRYRYNPGGGLKQVTDARGEMLIRWATSTAVEQVVVGGQVTAIELPTSKHEATRVLVPGARQPSEYRHDSRGRLVEVRQGGSVPLRRVYDAEGHLTLNRDASDERRFTWSDGKLTRVDSEATGATELEWDEHGRLLSARSGGVTTRYDYEGDTWAPSKVTDGDATTQYEYVDGSLQEITDPDGVTTEVGEIVDDGLISGAAPLAETAPECDTTTDGLALDSACRPVGLQIAGTEDAATAESSLSYDDYGRVAATQGPTGREEYTYDKRGRVASVKRGEVTFSNEYEHGRLSRVTTDDGAVFAEYGYDEAGRLETLDSGGASLRRSYDSSGQIRRIEDGGLVWEVTGQTRAGRPERIDTPYGAVTIAYDGAGRVRSTSVGESGGTVGGKSIDTTYDWTSTDTVSEAKVTRGGYVSKLTFDEGKVASARTPLGSWEYDYDGTNPDHLVAVSGPDGTISYSYGTNSYGALRLERITHGDQVRKLEWDDLGRLTKDQGGNADRFFEYRGDGITEHGAFERKVTWDESGLPVVVESDGTTELWAWNSDRTLRSIKVEGRRFPIRSGDQVWTAEYDDSRRLVELDRTDADDGLVLAWNDTQPRAPERIGRTGSEEVTFEWTDLGELRRATLADQEWVIDRDEFRNVVEISRSGERMRRISIGWHDGLPISASYGDDSMKVDVCGESECDVDLAVDGLEAHIEYGAKSIDATINDRQTTFARDDAGRITQGCQTLSGEQRCTDWTVDGDVGSRSELARFEELLGGTNGQLRGLVSRPLPPESPAITSLPEELRPLGDPIVLPDEQVEAAVAAAAPVLPETYRLGGDGAAVRLAQRLAPTSIQLPIGPGRSTTVDLFGDTGVAALDSPLDGDTPIGALVSALGGIEPDSILRGATDLAKAYGISAVTLVADLFANVATSAVAVVLAASACVSGSPSCTALAVTGALMGAADLLWLAPGVGGVMSSVLSAIAEAATAAVSGSSWPYVGIAFGTALLLGTFTKTPLGPSLLDRSCALKRVFCLNAARTPESAANVIAHQGRLGRWTVDRADAKSRRVAALRGTPPRRGFDRDEVPPAVTRQGGANARVAYVNPSDNRSAGASLRAAIRDLDDGQSFLVIVTEARDLPLVRLEQIAAAPVWLPDDDS